MIYLNLAAEGFKKIKRKRKLGRRLKQSGKELGLNLLKWGMIQGQKQSDLNLVKK